MSETKAKYIPVKISFGKSNELLDLLNSKDSRVVELAKDKVYSVVFDDLLKVLNKYDVAHIVPDEVFCRTVDAAVANIIKYYNERYIDLYGKRT